jgi:hypothetical protein
MIPLSEFEIHASGDIVGDLAESWVTIVHKRCGASLGEWDMIDLEDAVEQAVNHKCEPQR